MKELCLQEMQTDGQTHRQTGRVIPIYPFKTLFVGVIIKGLEEPWMADHVSDRLLITSMYGGNVFKIRRSSFRRDAHEHPP